MIRCAIVDDEPLAREGIEGYVAKIDFLDLVATVENPLALSSKIKGDALDLLFLDIHMPGMSGIDYLKVTRNRPMVILTTAYPNYAIEGFELDVLDYLVKPITFNRFFKAVEKAHDFHQLRSNPAKEAKDDNEQPAYFFVKCDQVYERIAFNDVLYAEAQENYVVIHTIQRKYMVLMPFKRMEELLGDGFIRVHKSWIVALDKVTSVEKNQLTIQSTSIPISRSYRSTAVDQIVGEKLWKK